MFAKSRISASDHRIMRAKIICDHNTLSSHAGSTSYLKCIIDLLSGVGFEVKIFITHPYIFQKIQKNPKYNVKIFRSVRIGAYFISYDLIFSAGRLLAKFIKSKPKNLSPSVWQMSARNPPHKFLLPFWDVDYFLIISNYVSSYKYFENYPNAIHAILTHDIFAKRKQSLEAIGAPLDFCPRMIDMEAEAFQRADICICITEDDRNFIVDNYPNIRAVYIPMLFPPMKFTERKPRRTCIFVGGLAFPNQSGIDWFIYNVWPLVLKLSPEARLRIVGSICRHLVNVNQNNIDIAGEVDDVSEEYISSAVAIVPLKYGSGLKIKLVEALRHGLPVVSTSVGAEGIFTESCSICRIADTPEEFAKAIVSYFDCDTAIQREAAILLPKISRSNTSRDKSGGLLKKLASIKGDESGLCLHRHSVASTDAGSRDNPGGPRAANGRRIRVPRHPPGSAE